MNYSQYYPIDVLNGLGMTLEPAIFNDAYRKLPQGIGLQCSIRF
jgi:hypothetical protein